MEGRGRRGGDAERAKAQPLGKILQKREVLLGQDHTRGACWNEEKRLAFNHPFRAGEKRTQTRIRRGGKAVENLPWGGKGAGRWHAERS